MPSSVFARGWPRRDLVVVVVALMATIVLGRFGPATAAAGPSTRPKPTVPPPTTRPPATTRPTPTTRSIASTKPPAPTTLRPTTTPRSTTLRSTTLRSTTPRPTTPPTSVTYRLPVDGKVVDGWRPPSNPYGAGNRGVDLATTPGQAVVAVADGDVTFAGPVAGVIWVVVLHADGVRSTLGPLADVTVSAGQTVVSGQIIGHSAGTSIHFGARVGDEYIDPLQLLGRGSIRLIPAR